MKNITVFIDPYTCKISNVSPEDLRDNLKASLSKYDADVVINHFAENSTYGDFSRTATVARVSCELDSGESEEKAHELNELVYKAAREIIAELKKLTPPSV